MTTSEIDQPDARDSRSGLGDDGQTLPESPRGTGYEVAEIDDVIEAFRSMSVDEILERGFRVDPESDEVDDPILLGPDGLPVRTWQEGYPYAEKLRNRDYQEDKRRLQIELLKAQDWIKETGHKLVIVFEGRDAAGKGGTIKRFTEHLNPRGAEVVALSVPTPREQGEWYFQRYVRHLPSSGEIRFFDRSWYNRAGVEPVMGYCTDAQHEEFLRAVPGFEQMLMNSDTTVIKLWFSVSRREQITRFTIRRIDPVRQWKLSPTDISSLDRWDDYTAAKLTMFDRTSSEHCPWTVVRSNDKKRGRVNAIRFVLSRLPYDGKNEDVVGEPDSMIVGRPEDVAADHGESAVT